MKHQSLLALSIAILIFSTGAFLYNIVWGSVFMFIYSSPNIFPAILCIFIHRQGFEKKILIAGCFGKYLLHANHFTILFYTENAKILNFLSVSAIILAFDVITIAMHSYEFAGRVGNEFFNPNIYYVNLAIYISFIGLMSGLFGLCVWHARRLFKLIVTITPRDEMKKEMV